MRLIASEGALGPADVLLDRYAYVAIDVPSEAAGVRVALDYSDRGPTTRRGIGNILDLGLFAPGRLDPGTPSFRGWSGSERSEIVVGEEFATPGYLPGQIEPGRWHAILGLCQVAPGGCSYRVTAEALGQGDPRLSRSFRVAHGSGEVMSQPAESGAVKRWWPGDLHCQTVHSDGRLSVDEIASYARTAGLEFLFVSDHNTTSHHAELAAAGVRAGIALHPAEEVTTYRGHLGAVGASGWVDFRHTDERGMAWAVAAVHGVDGFAVKNHPASPSSPWEFDTVRADAIEVWNGPWRTRNRNELALRQWVTELAAGRRPVAVGGSDMHDVVPDRQPIGTPVTWVHGPDSGLRSLLHGLRAGRVIVTRSVDGPHPRLTVRLPNDGPPTDVGGTLVAHPSTTTELDWQVLGGSGTELRILGPSSHLATLPLDDDDVTGSLRLEPADRPSFARLEVRAADDSLLAVTNPIYIEVPS